MKSIRTAQFNQPLAENQEEYHTLFMNLNTEDPYCPATVCFEFDQKEVEEFNKTHRLYYNQCLFRRPVHGEKDEVTGLTTVIGFEPAYQFHPMNISVFNPLDSLTDVKETRGAKDNNMISDDPDEIRTAAKACGVEKISIQLAKHVLKTNNRSEIYAWVNENKGSSFMLEI